MPDTQWMSITTKSRTVFQFHGCHFQDCPTCYPDREYVLHQEKGKNVTREDVCQRTLRRNEVIVQAEYNLVVRWEHEKPTPVRCRLPRKQNVTFPFAIVFDFESYQDPRTREAPTGDLVFESEHVPSRYLLPTLSTESRSIFAPDPNELLWLFWEALEKRAKVLRELVRQEYMPEDFELLSKVQRATIRDWCDQIPLLAFNFCTYDPGSALTFSKMQSPFLASRCSIFCAERCRIKMDQSSMPQTRRHIKCSKRPLSAGQAWSS